MKTSSRAFASYPCWLRNTTVLALVLSFPLVVIAVVFGSAVPWPAFVIGALLSQAALAQTAPPRRKRQYCLIQLARDLIRSRWAARAEFDPGSGPLTITAAKTSGDR